MKLSWGTPDTVIPPLEIKLPGESLPLLFFFFLLLLLLGASLVAQMVKNPPAVQETRVWFLGQEDPLEQEIAICSCILAWKSHEQRSLVGYSPWGHKELDTTEQLNHHLYFYADF